MLGKAQHEAELGTCFGGGLYEAEARWFVRNEWARTAEDVLWRRTKCGLHMSAAERDNFAGWIQRNVSLS